MQAKACLFAKMGSSIIYFGRFIDAPTATDLRIRTGAVLVSTDDGTGVIQKADWTVKSPKDAASKLDPQATVIRVRDDGFFFPGFIGEWSCAVSANQAGSLVLMPYTHRHTYTCTTVSKLWHLRQVHPSGLADDLYLSP